MISRPAKNRLAGMSATNSKVHRETRLLFSLGLRREQGTLDDELASKRRKKMNWNKASKGSTTGGLAKLSKPKA